MKKSLIALAVLAASGAAMAQSSVTLYGIADVAVAKVKGQSATMASGGVSTSRWGLKGAEDLGGGLKANFTFEQGVDLTSGAASGFDRQAWVGLSGGFGEVKLGKTWNAYDDIVGATSPLFDSNFLTTNRLALSYAMEAGNPNKGVYYATPSFGGVSGAVSTTFKEGDANARVNAFHVKYEGGPLFVGFAYEQQKSDLGDVKLSRLQGSYDLGAAKLLASYGQVKDLGKDYTLGVDVPLSAALTLSAGLTQTKLDGTDLKPGTVGVAANYSLSKRTSVYTGFNKDNKDAGDGNRFALGLKHVF